MDAKRTTTQFVTGKSYRDLQDNGVKMKKLGSFREWEDEGVVEIEVSKDDYNKHKKLFVI